jgi:hypothetical protein
MGNGAQDNFSKENFIGKGFSGGNSSVLSVTSVAVFLNLC